MLDLIYEEPKPKVYSGTKGDWELVIGMEVHAQVASKSKLFSGAFIAAKYIPYPAAAPINPAPLTCNSLIALAISSTDFKSSISRP